MTTIRTRLTVPADGNVVVQVGAAEAGTEVDVVVSTSSSIKTVEEGESTTSRERWIEHFLKLEGSIDDPSFQRPDQPPLDPVESLD